MAPTPTRPLATLFARLVFFGALGATWYLGSEAKRGISGREEAATRELDCPVQFRRLGPEAGFAFTHEAPRLDPRLDPVLPQIAGTGAAVSAVDADQDGALDLYATTGGDGKPNALFVRRGERFEEVAADAGLAQLNRAGEFASHGSVWADLDHDGDQDVLVYGWGRQRLLRNEGELQFTEVSAEAGLDLWMNAVGAVLFDANADGWLDLLLLGYYREDTNLWELETTRILHEDQEFAMNGGRNRFFVGGPGLTFTERTEESGLAGNRWSYAAAAADLDADGDQDLYIANDYGTEEVWRNDGTGRFELWPDLGLDAESKSGMCVALGDATNSGRLAAYVTNITEPGFLQQGNNLRDLRLGDQGLQTNRANAISANCGWAWGADWGDLDCDGLLDLVVVNGFRSANPKKEYWYQMGKLAGGVGGLLEDATHWAPFEDMSLSGYQQSAVLLNRGRWSFADVSPSSGIDDRHDGRAVILADLWDDGMLDVVVANQNGPLVVYRNESPAGAHWIGFDLRGSASNPDGIGAEVLVRFGGETQLQVVTAGHGFSSQTDPRIHVGLGERTVADEVVIRWPSGVEQTLTNLPAGAYHKVQEPES
jgi:hypothetical protein